MRKPVNILVATYWSYKDPLIQTYTLPYLKQIKQVVPDESRIYLLTFEQDKFKINIENGELDRIEDELSKHNISLIRFNYLKRGAMVYFKLAWNFIYLIFFCFSRKITHIHTWCMPGGAIGYVLSLITRKPLILDSYEPHAEIMLESDTWKRNDLSFKLLFKLEALQSKRASHVIGTTKAMEHYAKEKYRVEFTEFHVKPACIDLEKFSNQNVKNKNLLEQLNLVDKIVAVYAGKFGDSYLESEVFELFKIAHEHWGERFRVLLLNNHEDSYIKKMAGSVGLDFRIITKMYVDHHKIPDYIGLGDFGLTPFVPVPSKRYGTPIKDGEYWALGLPVIITKDISDDSDIIASHKIGYVLQDLTVQEYKKAISFIDTLISQNSRPEIYDLIRPIAEKYRNYYIADAIYKKIYA
ncbi:hypothetical protein QQ020_28090 [Fulvivirgaceae bacterium BMA12]|uniref:Glycosyltransferase n=1 Tax=Agaribacillus aureus TaxID=3051825 RepID=A0ABT8LFL0_9BACT|nr:hypothetical protein [Fulvivirgaceae bacterium BMA12]